MNKNKHAIKSAQPGQFLLLLQAIDHDMGQGLKINFMFPAPVFPGFGVVDRAGPGIGCFLAVVRLVGDLEIGDQLLDFVGEFLGFEADCGKVVACPHLDVLLRGLHELNCSPDSIIHIHHRQHRILPNKTLILPMPDRLIKNRNRIISRPPSRLPLPANNPRIPQTPNIKSIPPMIVLTEQLACKLSNPIHRSRLIDRMLRRLLTRGCRPEAGY